MVLTERQRRDLHVGIYEYLKSRGDSFAAAAEAFAQADPEVAPNNGGDNNNSRTSTTTPLLEKKWTAIPRLQKKVLELERSVAQSAKIHAHRVSANVGDENGNAAAVTTRRMLPRLPCHHTLQGHSAVVTAVAVHPVFTVVASGSEDGTVKVWDHESGDYIRTLKGHTNTVNSVSFSPTGSHMASCSTDLSIKLWDFSSYACLRTLRGHDHTISSVRFLPLPGLTASSGPSQSTTTTGMDAATAGAQHVLSASRDATVKLWDVETGFCDATYTDHNDWVRCLAIRVSDGGLWASAGNDTTIFVYDAKSKTKLTELRGHEHVVESVAFISEEPLTTTARVSKHVETVRDYLVSGSRDRSVRLWKISDASVVAVLTAHENWVRSVLLHPSGNYIISSADDKTIRVFDIKAKRCLRTLEKAHNHFVTALDMHPSLPILVSGSVDQTVKCWQLD